MARCRALGRGAGHSDTEVWVGEGDTPPALGEKSNEISCMQLGGVVVGGKPPPHADSDREEPRGALAWWHRCPVGAAGRPGPQVALEGPRFGTRSREVNTEGIHNPTCQSHCPPESLQRTGTRRQGVLPMGRLQQRALWRMARGSRGTWHGLGPSKRPRRSWGGREPQGRAGGQCRLRGSLSCSPGFLCICWQGWGASTAAAIQAAPGAGGPPRCEEGRQDTASVQTDSTPSPNRPHRNTVVCLHCSVSTLVVWLLPGASARVLDSGGKVRVRVPCWAGNPPAPGPPPPFTLWGQT